MRLPGRFRLFQFFVVLAAQLLVSCSVPLGPGYSVKKRSLEVRYLAGDAPHLEIHARYQLKNIGSRSLSSLDVRLPSEKIYGRKNLRATIDGEAVVTSPQTTGDAVRISFPRPWAQREEHELTLEYELSGQSAAYVGMAMAGDSLFLSSAGWYPVLRPPEGLFGKGSDQHSPLELSVRVPQGYRAHSSGRARGARKENGELVYRFQIGKDDFDPFVVAGRYFEQRFHNADATILFWRLKGPLPKDQLEHAGTQLSASLKKYESNFGLLSKKKEPYRVVEMLDWPYSLVGGILAVNTPNFPRGAVVATLDDSSVQANDYFMTLAAYDLAQSWFGIPARPESGESFTLNQALCRYAINFVPAESSGPRLDRSASMRRALRQYSQLQAQGREQTLISMAETMEPEDRRRALAKGELFLVALEDRCGQDNLRLALRHISQSLRGSTYGYNELHSALEQECHQDLGPMFREWLTETGIPADFRRRYESQP